MKRHPKIGPARGLNGFAGFIQDLPLALPGVNSLKGVSNLLSVYTNVAHIESLHFVLCTNGRYSCIVNNPIVFSSIPVWFYIFSNNDSPVSSVFS